MVTVKKKWFVVTTKSGFVELQKIQTTKQQKVVRGDCH